MIAYILEKKNKFQRATLLGCTFPITLTWGGGAIKVNVFDVFQRWKCRRNWIFSSITRMPTSVVSNWPSLVAGRISKKKKKNYLSSNNKRKSLWLNFRKVHNRISRACRFTYRNCLNLVRHIWSHWLQQLTVARTHSILFNVDFHLAEVPDKQSPSIWAPNKYFKAKPGLSGNIFLDYYGHHNTMMSKISSLDLIRPFDPSFFLSLSHRYIQTYTHAYGHAHLHVAYWV